MTRSCQIFLLPLTVILFTIFTGPTPSVSAAKILGLFAHPSEGHFAVMRSMMTELARRRHNVTVYSSHQLPEPVENLREIVIEPEFPFWRELQKDAGVKGGLHELSKLPEATLQRSLATVGSAAVDYFLAHASVQQLLALPGEVFDYDLIIVDLFYTEALLALGYLHGIPTIAVVSTDFENYMQHVLENTVPAACAPVDFESTADVDGYWQRLSIIRNCIARRKNFVKYNIPEQEKIIRKHFKHFQAANNLEIPELQANLAVLLLNNHVPLATARPFLPHTIAAGGLHIRPTRELPWHILRFLDEARSGVIYMNLGNEQHCREVPKEKLQTLFSVFTKRKVRVLWTCHDVQTLENLPEDIMIQHSVAQSDILAHPHVKIFVMNGDLLSIQESIVRYVPMLGIPIFRNEVRNMHTVEHLGAGIQLAHDNVTELSLNWALDTLSKDLFYRNNIRDVCTTFRDRPLGALETSMYWIDYVLRHKGAPQLRTQGVGLPSNQLHLTDLFIFYFAVALLIVVALVAAYFCAQFVRRWRQEQKLISKMN